MPRRHARYDDEFDVSQPDGYDNPTSAGMIGFITSLVSIGLLAVVALLYVLLKQENQQQENIERTRLMLYWFLCLDVLSFVTAFAGTILGGRGLSPTNPLYRGWSMAALILGIVGIVLTAVLFLIMTCALMIFEAINNVRGG